MDTGGINANKPKTEAGNGNTPVPPLEQQPPTGLSFGSMLAQFVPSTNPKNLLVKGLSGASDEGLKSRRLKIAGEIREAMKAGDQEGLHKLQEEYDSITAELRSRYSGARLASTTPLETANAAKVQSLATTNVPVLKDETSKPESSRPQAIKIEAPRTEPQPPQAEPPKPVSTLSPVDVPKAGITRTQLPQEKPLPNVFGVPDDVWQKVANDERIRSALLSMPKEAVALYKQTTPEEKKELAKHISEKTRVLFFTIDNRQAFITGQVMGRDTFQYLVGAIDKQINEGKITMDEGMRRKSALNILRNLSPDQREGFIRLIEGESRT